MLARVNSFREEPGGSGRVFVNDLNGPLYILDKTTKALTTYLNFNGRDNSRDCSASWPGKSASPTARHAQFDPELFANGRFYTVHIEEPAVEALAVPTTRRCPAFNATGYTPTADRHAGTDHARRRADRVDRHESVEHDVRRHGPRTAAPAAQRPHSSARRRRLQSGRAPRRSRLARAVRRAATAAPASRRGPDTRSNPSGSTRSSARSSASSRASTIRRRRARSATTGATASPTTTRSSLFAARARKSGRRLPQPASTALGDRSGQREEQSADRQLHRHAHLGNDQHRPQGRELRLLAARRQRGDGARAT